MAPPPALYSASLCSGIGGLDLGLAALLPTRTVVYVEREAYVAACLAARMADGNLDHAPVWSDIHTFDADRWRGVVDCVTAGYPCQPFSGAGHRRGTQDERHLWPAIARHVSVLYPALVVLKNVPGHLTRGFDEVAADLQALGYSVQAGLFEAREVGSPQRRKRLFAAAVADGSRDRLSKLWQAYDDGRHEPWHELDRRLKGMGDTVRLTSELQREQGDVGSQITLFGTEGFAPPESQPRPTSEGVVHPTSELERVTNDQTRTISREDARATSTGRRQRVDHTDESRLEGSHQPEHSARTATPRSDRPLGPWPPGRNIGPDEWPQAAPEPVLRGGTPRIPHRVDRLRALGNAVVPAQASWALWNLLEPVLGRKGMNP